MKGPQPNKRPEYLPECLIVGGGVMGCTLLYTLAARGARVTLVEKGEVGRSGASSVPVALLNPYRGRSGRASAFDLESLAVTWRLVKEIEGLGLETGVRRSGVLRISSNAKQVKTWRKLEGVRWLEPGEVPGVYHAPFGGFLAEAGGWLEPRTFLQALVRAAEGYGGEVVRGEVTALTPDPHGYLVHTTAGKLTADTVLLCTGSEGGLVELGGLERVAGEIIGLDVDARLPYPLAGAVYGAQAGSLYLGGNHRPAHLADESAPAQLQRAGGWFIPAARKARLESVWSGVRLKAADNLPVVRALRPNLLFVGALAGRGFLCAAKLAQDLAAYLKP